MKSTEKNGSQKNVKLEIEKKNYFFLKKYIKMEKTVIKFGDI